MAKILLGTLFVITLLAGGLWVAMPSAAPRTVSIASGSAHEAAGSQSISSLPLKPGAAVAQVSANDEDRMAFSETGSTPALTAFPGATGATTALTSNEAGHSAAAASPGPILDGNEPVPNRVLVIPASLVAGGLELELTAGVRAPSVLVEPQQAGSEQPMAPAVAAAKDQLAQKFTQEVAAAFDQPQVANAGQPLEYAWEQAKLRADAHFKALYGDAAANQAGMQAALEAMVGTHP